MRIRTGVPVLGIVVLSCSLAVGTAVADTASQTDPAPTATPTTNSTTAPTDAPEVELLARGSAPRKELRYAMPVGTSQTLELRTFSRISQRQDGKTRSGGTPNITFTIAVDVTQVADSGDLTYGYRYDDAELGSGGVPGSRGQTEELLQSVIGIGGTVTITDAGEPVDSSFVVPDTVDERIAPLLDQLGSQTDQLATPLPQEAVGVGARWRVTQHPEVGGIEFTQSVVIEVEAIKGSRVTLSTRTVQRAGRQEFTPPGSDTTVLLLSSKGTGTGTTTLEPAKAPLPVTSQNDIRVVQRLRQGSSTLSQTVQSAAFINS